MSGHRVRQDEAGIVWVGVDRPRGVRHRRRLPPEGQLLCGLRLPEQEQCLHDGAPRLESSPFFLWPTAGIRVSQILCNYGIFLSIVSAKLLIALFFGNLRTIELERMHDRLWFTVTETLLALAMFREDFDALFVVLFVSLIVIKCFHWLAADRVEWVRDRSLSSRRTSI